MIELMEVIVIVAAMALVVLAVAAFALCMTAIRVESHMERLVLMDEMDKPAVGPITREKPPDSKRKPQTDADEYLAPMVRRAKKRLDRAGAEVRSDGHG